MSPSGEIAFGLCTLRRGMSPPGEIAFSLIYFAQRDVSVWRDCIWPMYFAQREQFDLGYEEPDREKDGKTTSEWIGLNRTSYRRKLTTLEKIGCKISRGAPTVC